MYKGLDISLSDEQLELIKEIYLEYNSSPLFADYPLIHYLGYHQRKAGCFGAGNRFFYIDTEGDAHICPYCTNKIGSARHLSADQMIDLLEQQKCHQFTRNTLI
jgi:MoaA/NifB/PqqE/SkfB family radical SAM enzyme